MDEFLKEFLEAPVSRVQKSLLGLNFLIYGKNGSGKTPIACGFPKPYHVSASTSALSGINNVPYKFLNSWAEAKNFVEVFSNPDYFEALNTKYDTIIFDEVELLWTLCEKYICNTHNVTRINDGNGGYGLWQELSKEWNSFVIPLMNSRFTTVTLMHEQYDDKLKRYMPVGDMKRCLPPFLNNCDVIGWLAPGAVNPETNRPGLTDLYLMAGHPQFLARTKNEYFPPVIEGATAENIKQAYFDAVEAKENSEGVRAVTLEEREEMFKTEKVDFDKLIEELGKAGEAIDAQTRTELIEEVLGAGARVSQCTEKQTEALQILLGKFKKAAGN